MIDPFPRLLVLGHRGVPADAPENTLRSFDLALRQGADGVELDVRRAHDGTPVVIHDATLERTFGVDRAVDALDWPAIQRLTGSELPSLQQAAAWAAAAGAWVNVELKEGGVELETIDILQSHGILDRTFLSSFDPHVVARVGEVSPGSQRFFLTERWDEAARERFGVSGAGGVCLRVDAATPPALDVLRREGLAVVIWTVDDPVRIAELVDARVAGIISNRPASAVAAVRAAEARQS